MDIIDQANRTAEQALARSLAKISAKPTACSRLFCEDCEQLIPEARRQKVQGCTRCVDCQQLFEQRAKAYRK